MSCNNIWVEREIRISSPGIERKKEIPEKHKCLLCGSNTNIVNHHLIPRCLENGNRTTPVYTDEYVRPIFKLYEKILHRIPPNKISNFRTSIRSKIHTRANETPLCKRCHTRLHQGRLEKDELLVKKAFKNLPESLDTEQVNKFFIDEIIIPALKEINCTFVG